MRSADRKSGERERELKLGLPDRESFERLRATIGGRRRPTVHQENTFFDSAAGALETVRISCRIRRAWTDDASTPPVWTLTLKGPRLDGDRAFQAERVEFEIALEPRIAEDLLADPSGLAAWLDRAAEGCPPGERRTLIDRVRARVAAAEWRTAGTFLNDRTPVDVVLPDDPSGRARLIELDETFFPHLAEGQPTRGSDRRDVDFEVELELAPEDDDARVEAALRERFVAAGVEPVDLGSKLGRLRRRRARDARA